MYMYNTHLIITGQWSVIDCSQVQVKFTVTWCLTNDINIGHTRSTVCKQPELHHKLIIWFKFKLQETFDTNEIKIYNSTEQK